MLNEFGDHKLGDIELANLLDLKKHLQGTGCSDSTIRNTFVPLQAIYRRTRRNGTVATNPTIDLGLPTAGKGDRAASPQEAAALLAALLPDPEHAMWATAFYAGLRRGEFRALRVRHVDVEAATITGGSHPLRSVAARPRRSMVCHRATRPRTRRVPRSHVHAQ